MQLPEGKWFDQGHLLVTAELERTLGVLPPEQDLSQC